ncbi:MAG: hypothetical protein R6U21_06875 [Thermoplasmatota archaeon]
MNTTEKLAKYYDKLVETVEDMRNEFGDCPDLEYVCFSAITEQTEKFLKENMTWDEFVLVDESADRFCYDLTKEAQRREKNPDHDWKTAKELIQGVECQ